MLIIYCSGFEICLSEEKKKEKDMQFGNSFFKSQVIFGFIILIDAYLLLLSLKLICMSSGYAG